MENSEVPSCVEKALPEPVRKSLLESPASGVQADGGKLSVVGFSVITIREYPVEVGDNPSCVRGPPLSIGWKFCRKSL